MKRVTRLAGAAVLLFASACQSAPKPEHMVPNAHFVQRCHRASARVERAPLEYSHRDRLGITVRQSALLEAVRRAVAGSGVFEPASGDPDYRIQVSVFDVTFESYRDLPRLTVVTAHWRLLDSEGEILYDEIVRTGYSAGLFLRVTDSKEGALRENIQEGIRRLSLLRLHGEDEWSPCGARDADQPSE